MIQTELPSWPYNNSANRLLSIGSVIFVLMLSSNSLAGKLYKIVDKNGKVTFSQFPPKESSEENKVEDIAVKTTGAAKLAVRTVGDTDYCGDIRLSNYRSAYKKPSSNIMYLERRLTEWQKTADRYDKELERITNRQFDRSTSRYAKRENNTQKNNRYKQYQHARNQTLDKLKQYRCAIDWAKNQQKGLNGEPEVGAINDEIKRLKTVYKKLEIQLQDKCGTEPPFDPTTKHKKENTRRWNTCAKTYKKDMGQVESKIRNASTRARY